MNRALFFAIAMLASSCANTPSHLIAPAGFASGVQTGQIDAEHFDFIASGFFDSPFETRAGWLASTSPLLQAPTREKTCEPDYLRSISARPWVELAALASDQLTWAESVLALRAWSTRLDALIETRLRGAEPGLTGTALTIQNGLNANRSNPQLRELFTRVIRDQTLRGALAPTSNGTMTIGDSAGMPPLAAQVSLTAVAVRIGTTDCSNTQWLRIQLTEVHWFDIPTYGEASDLAAGLLAIHADNDPDFQLMVARRLEALPNSHTSKIRMANLYDRALVSQNRMQRYGIQGECIDGSWTTAPIEDASNVDARRAVQGLPPLADYISSQATRYCVE